ncbi:helix-turn-helix domain-containing protein [Bradyrhizobium sp. CB2312]|uniref:helix-turn-helix domain-containing protein n=1 Tax=Bradyrhizobium sp. CB2312 TaxID=3039155 RepID=UPI0024B1485C|nr:helix-turn-helix domain-containing protein [Bradyrhizobium sp. CB2312]WFU75527.1 helix-turn-helix domain-containing protein [Bradyrhizobium sp. CB2312]
MQRFDVTLPQITAIGVKAGRTAIGFLTDEAQVELRHCGNRLESGEIVIFGHDLVHQRSATALRFGTMSLASKDLSRLYAIIVGEELPQPPGRRVIRPVQASMARLRALHKTVGNIAQDLPGLLGRTEVRRALEEKLVHAMVRCLADNSVARNNAGDGRHCVIMRRFEQFLASNADRPLYLAELCAAVGVPERTLRASCEQYFGMGPIRYLTLRRMHLARRALLCTEPSKASVTRVVTDHGFWELGRFSVAYRTLFGESPSDTLRRSAEHNPADLRRPSYLSETAMTLQ